LAISWTGVALATTLPTLPRRGKFTEYFPPKHGGRGFTAAAPRHASAAKKILPLPQEKLVASSLPQDSSAQLMFGAAGFGEPALSASRGLGFHIAPRGGHSPHCLRTLASPSTSEGFWMLRDALPRHAA
jgi:hypothetical protein